MPQDQRAAWHLVPSHGALSSGLAAHAPHGPVGRLRRRGATATTSDTCGSNFSRSSDTCGSNFSMLQIRCVPCKRSWVTSLACRCRTCDHQSNDNSADHCSVHAVRLPGRAHAGHCDVHVGSGQAGDDPGALLPGRGRRRDAPCRRWLASGKAPGPRRRAGTRVPTSAARVQHTTTARTDACIIRGALRVHWLWRPGVRSAVSRKVIGSDLRGCPSSTGG